MKRDSVLCLEESKGDKIAARNKVPVSLVTVQEEELTGRDGDRSRAPRDSRMFRGLNWICPFESFHLLKEDIAFILRWCQRQRRKLLPLPNLKPKQKL